MKIRIIVFLILTLIMAGLAETFLPITGSGESIAGKPSNYALVEIAGQTLRAKIAYTEKEKTRGLSNTPSLAAAEGMIFYYPNAGRYSFWMKDMNYPLDIIWLNSNAEVIAIEENVSPDSFPRSFGPNADSNYVLEINAGKAREWGITKGTKLVIREMSLTE